MSIDALRAYIKTCPLKPGVYLIKNSEGIPIYIGKARALKSRLQSHFGPKYHPDFKERMIRKDARRIDIVETPTEAEALLLEASLIKEHKPQYNRELKDDKSYPYLKITDEEFPRLLIVRGRKGDGSRYFGPYTNVRLLRQSVSMLKRLFPLRTCHPMPDKVCLMYHIGQCLGPCEGEIGKGNYHEIVKELTLFLEGKRDALIRNLGKRMKVASEKQDYEAAKILRDQMKALSVVPQKKIKEDKNDVLLDLQQHLKLSRFPKRIEAFDISNFSGKNPVGSMVCFLDGKPSKKEYRRFKIKTVDGINDYDMMREIVRRRYERLLADKQTLPDLILIDGGRGHLSSAKAELDTLNLSDLDVISIAKQHEYIFKPLRNHPYVFPQSSPVLRLLQYLRDEAHRFAITFYRRLHRKEMTWSELDSITGVGMKRRNALMKKFKRISMIRVASREDLLQTPGIDSKTAKNIEEYFKRS